MLKAGILRETTSPICKTPIFPVKKANDSWRMIQDLRAVNEIVKPEPVVVANPSTILNGIDPKDKYFSVIDLSNTFFSVKLDLESQDYFAFQYGPKTYTYTRLPQGFKNSPTLYSQALQASMTKCPALTEGQYLLYVDDILVTGHTEEACEHNTITVLKHLYEEGHKASKPKMQFCQPSVTYLGLCNYCRTWIPNYTQHSQPLQTLIHGKQMAMKDKIQWTPEAEKHFSDLKCCLQTDTVLSFPNYSLPFVLFVSSQQGYMSAALTQPFGGKQRPVAYYSKRLDSVASDLPSCVQACIAVAVALDSCTELVLTHPLEVKLEHNVPLIL